jgi:hypothetical protein
VGVTDGLSVTGTREDGTFELISNDRQEFVYLSLPSGYRIPVHPTGIARFYQRLRPASNAEAEVLFDLEPLPYSDESHAMLLLADVQTEDDREMGWFHEQTVPDVLSTIQSLNTPEAFGIACGDIMYDNLELYPEYERAVSRMGVPFFQVVGNHDLDQREQVDEGSTATFSRHFGPRYYSFDRGSVHYVVLDDVLWYGTGYIGYLERDQLAWLENDLARIEPGRTVVVALHIPVLGSRHSRENEPRPGISTSITNREALYRLLEPFQAYIVSGHMHEHEHTLEHGAHEIVNGTVCGAWWSGPICGDGTPSGYTVFEMREGEVRWTHKSTGRGFQHQIRAYARGADPGAPDEVVANIWDWDPEWTVVWYEDGERKGPMARRTGRDPLSVQLHAGRDLPPRRPGVEPYPTGHLFYAPTSATAREVRIEATDRFRRVHTALVPAPERDAGPEGSHG